MKLPLSPFEYLLETRRYRARGYLAGEDRARPLFNWVPAQGHTSEEDAPAQAGGLPTGQHCARGEYRTAYHAREKTTESLRRFFSATEHSDTGR